MLDELERVRKFRADAAPPTPEATSDARARLLDAIEAAQAAPAPTPNRPPGRTVRRRQRRRRLILAGGIACVAVAIAGALGLPTGTSSRPALAAAMDQLAQVAAGQAWSGIPGPGEYQYTESEGLTEADTMASNPTRECAVQQVEHRQAWIATDGSGAISDTRDQGRFTSPADQATCAAIGITDPGSQDSSWSNTFPKGGLSFPTNNWHSLSTDPATLLDQLRTLDGGPRTPGEDFVHIGDFLRESDTPPAIRSALYRAAALIPGVQLLGVQTDPTGRSGLAVRLGGAELIFDQQTGSLLAEEDFAADGTLAGWTAYLQSKIVDSLPGYPPTPLHAQPSAG